MRMQCNRKRTITAPLKIIDLSVKLLITATTTGVYVLMIVSEVNLGHPVSSILFFHLFWKRTFIISDTGFYGTGTE